MRLIVELRHLRYFVAVAEELSFTRAAERLHMAQPPLSQQIRRLEQRLGVTLLLRSTKRPVELTDAGRIFLEQARRIIQSVQQATLLAQRAERGEIGGLVVGFLDYTSYTLIPPVLRAFRERFPDVDVVLRMFPNTELLAALRSGQVDVSFLRPPIDDPGISSALILREPFILAIPATHPLAGRRVVSIKDFAKDPFVMYVSGSDRPFHNEIFNFCGNAGFSPKVALEVSQIHAAVGLVGSGIGVALVPQSAKRVHLDDVVYKPLTGQPPEADVVLAWQQRIPSRIIEAFLETCKTTVASSFPSAKGRRKARRTTPLPRR